MSRKRDIHEQHDQRDSEQDVKKRRPDSDEPASSSSDPVISVVTAEETGKKSKRNPTGKFQSDYGSLHEDLIREKRKEGLERIKRDLFEDEAEEERARERERARTKREKEKQGVLKEDKAAAKARARAHRDKLRDGDFDEDDAAAKPKRSERRGPADDDDDDEDSDAPPEDAIRQVEGEEELEGDAADAGVAIEPFNLRSEMQEGYFDKNGHYVERRRGADYVRDPWLDEVDESAKSKKPAPPASAATSEPVKPRPAAKAKPQPRAQADEDDELDQEDLLLLVMRSLEPNETTWDALRRFKRLNQMDRFNRLTEAADRAAAAGALDVHNLKREEIAARVQPAPSEPAAAAAAGGQAAAGAASEADAAADADAGELWQYVAPPADGRGQPAADAALYGAFTSGQMRGWAAAGYFRDSALMLVRSNRRVPAWTRSDRIDWTLVKPQPLP